MAINYRQLEKTADPGFKFTGQSIGSIVSDLINYIFVFAGIGLLIYLILGGFQFLTSKGDPKIAQQAQSKITNALIGFLIIFASFWIVRIIGMIIGGDFAKNFII